MPLLTSNHRRPVGGSGARRGKDNKRKKKEVDKNIYICLQQKLSLVQKLRIYLFIFFLITFLAAALGLLKHACSRFWSHCHSNYCVNCLLSFLTLLLLFFNNYPLGCSIVYTSSLFWLHLISLLWYSYVQSTTLGCYFKKKGLMPWPWQEL